MGIKSAGLCIYVFLSEVDLACLCCGVVAANLNIHTLAPSYHLLSLLSLQRQNFFNIVFTSSGSVSAGRCCGFSE